MNCYKFLIFFVIIMSTNHVYATSTQVIDLKNKPHYKYIKDNQINEFHIVYIPFGYEKMREEKNKDWVGMEHKIFTFTGIFKVKNSKYNKYLGKVIQSTNGCTINLLETDEHNEYLQHSLQGNIPLNPDYRGYKTYDDYYYKGIYQKPYMNEPCTNTDALIYLLTRRPYLIIKKELGEKLFKEKRTEITYQELKDNIEYRDILGLEFEDDK